MARYEYRCTAGHTVELIQPMTDDLPEHVICERQVPSMLHPGEARACGAQASRQYTPPAAIIFSGPGFYSTDVKSRVERKRRPNPGDDLYRPFDAAGAAIAADNGVRAR